MEKRQLTTAEIAILEKNLCSCSNWNLIKVAADFSPQTIHRVQFLGEVSIGHFNSTPTNDRDYSIASGIYNATIHNCEIGNNVIIRNVNDIISNYAIGDNCIIENIGTLLCTGKQPFGNGTIISPLNETGGRSMPIFNQLTSQIAHLLLFYRFNKSWSSHLLEMIQQEIQQINSTKGIIETNVLIKNCSAITDVYFESNVTANGCLLLENGTLLTHSFVGAGVIAKNFILSSDSQLNEGANITNCFIGEGCEISKQFTAENSLFFANSHCLQGEACSIVAGPFTVSHHKSTLLIGGAYSYFNAGSGTNQSNHLYKLGPLHQGILERGSKTASGTYLLWPALSGAYSLISGRHYAHFDSSSFPFSYILEKNGTSILLPGINLQTVGLLRDGNKWKNRDSRNPHRKKDILNNSVFQPYSISKLIEGLQILQSLDFSTQDNIVFNNLLLSKSATEKGIKLYQQALIIYLGNQLLIHHQDKSENQVPILPNESWIDIGGMIISNNQLEKNISSASTLDEFNKLFRKSESNFYSDEWQWCQIILKDKFNVDFQNVTNNKSLLNFLHLYKEAVGKYLMAIEKDIAKEYEFDIQISFGFQGTPADRKKDFETVRNQEKELKIWNEIKADYLQNCTKLEFLLKNYQK